MKHLPQTLWALGFALIGFAILAQMAWAIIEPIKGLLLTIAIGVSLAYLGLRLYRRFYGGHSYGDSLTRGR